MGPDQEQLFIKSYKEHTDALFRFCYMRVSDRELAKDLLQDVFLKAWQYLQKGNEVKSMKSFLFSVATNAVIDEYRKKKASSLDSLSDQGFDVGVDDREALVETLDGKRAMAFLGSIPKKYRDAIYLQYVEGLSLKEISQITGESPNNISVRVHRGLEKLREILDNQK